MTAIKILEKLGVDPASDLSQLTEQDRAELEALMVSMSDTENQPALTIVKPDSPEEEKPKEPKPESVSV
ncbi:hypothetical protein FJ444_05155 [Aestuariibacter sp. GS-14]|uniref:hypothetical protein n=1 Tax=Aestuariibacter sp. GS-14 TaxID=2590670 RepID=UPI00112ECE6F|nr:hypothetical protein [Aestuariibacter sp. GS-14]TPV61008.1 hypothetical protein FJ444_05155 [Aestuariibacter sp. GS-14]